MTAAAGEPGTPRAARRVPAAVWALCVVQLLAALAWSVLTPVLRGPDEPAHVDLAWQLARSGPAWLDPVDTELSAAVLAALPRAHPDAELDPDSAYVLLDPAVRATRFTAAAAPPRAERRALAELPAGEATARTNQMTAHPLPPYLVGAGVLAAAPADTAHDAHAWLLRVLVALVAAPLPALAHATARRAGADTATGLTAAGLVLAVPMLTHLAGTFNNDLPLATLGGVLALGLARLAGGDAGTRTGLLLGGSIGAGALIKAFALLWPPAVLVAAGVAWRTRRAPAAAVGRCVALAGVVAAGLGAWWWVRNLIVHGTVQPGGVLYEEGGAPAVDAGRWLVLAASRLPLRFFGQLGWSEVALPWTLVWALTAVGAVAVAAVLVGRAGRESRRAALALLAPAAVTYVAVLASAWSIYQATGQPAGLQGRYLYGGLVGLVVVVAVGVHALAGRAAPLAPPVTLLAAGTVQLVAVAAVLDHWYGPPQAGVGERLAAVVGWSPLPPAATVGIGGLTVVAGVVALATLIAAARDGASRAGPARRRRGAPPPTASGR